MADRTTFQGIEQFATPAGQVRATFQGIEQFATPNTGVPHVTFQGIEQFATPNTGVPHVTFIAIEICVDLDPVNLRPRRFGIAA